ncbi:hypothetical protein GCK72_022546 [Caenorhabditis remanei]|uniref:Uncharacterized protein n=1 Tax=Caenorhabditis remanei TaxID=31234 RepID=A0A6A5FU78_CAERE|nr:hypothetical protein GCK72_022546 [Caenorhabditis remanei]KAF1746094.1 hypothetical protein GCK72_022546 [Caenorhabditis remanei]
MMELQDHQDCKEIRKHKELMAFQGQNSRINRRPRRTRSPRIPGLPDENNELPVLPGVTELNGVSGISGLSGPPTLPGSPVYRGMKEQPGPVGDRGLTEKPGPVRDAGDDGLSFRISRTSKQKEEPIQLVLSQGYPELKKERGYPRQPKHDRLPVASRQVEQPGYLEEKEEADVPGPPGRDMLPRGDGLILVELGEKGLPVLLEAPGLRRFAEAREFHGEKGMSIDHQDFPYSAQTTNTQERQDYLERKECEISEGSQDGQLGEPRATVLAGPAYRKRERDSLIEIVVNYKNNEKDTPNVFNSFPTKLQRLRKERTTRNSRTRTTLMRFAMTARIFRISRYHDRKRPFRPEAKGESEETGYTREKGGGGLPGKDVLGLQPPRPPRPQNLV